MRAGSSSASVTEGSTTCLSTAQAVRKSTSSRLSKTPKVILSCRLWQGRCVFTNKRRWKNNGAAYVLDVAPFDIPANFDRRLPFWHVMSCCERGRYFGVVVTEPPQQGGEMLSREIHGSRFALFVGLSERTYSQATDEIYRHFRFFLWIFYLLITKIGAFCLCLDLTCIYYYNRHSFFSGILPKSVAFLLNIGYN